MSVLSAFPLLALGTVSMPSESTQSKYQQLKQDRRVAQSAWLGRRDPH